MSKASDQITEYLSVGGLFNPEMMNQTQHEAVRDTLIKARDDIQSLERENAALNHALNIAQTELRLNGCAKAADEVAKLLDAARKEAQP